MLHRIGYERWACFSFVLLLRIITNVLLIVSLPARIIAVTITTQILQTTVAGQPNTTQMLFPILITTTRTPNFIPLVVGSMTPDATSCVALDRVIPPRPLGMADSAMLWNGDSGLASNLGNRWSDLEATLICRLARRIPVGLQVGLLEEAEHSLQLGRSVQTRKRSLWLRPHRRQTHIRSG